MFQQLFGILFVLILLFPAIVDAEAVLSQKSAQGHDHAPNRLEKVKIAVQPILNAMALKHNTSFSFGFVEAAGSLGLAGGIDNIWDRTALTPQTLIPLGSVTKPWTAVRIMQAVEAGRLPLDDLASQWIDPVLARLGGKEMRRHGITPSLVGLWGPAAAVVTIRDLLGMTSGFADYDDAKIMNWTLYHGGDDMGPFFYVFSASKAGFVCQPRTCAAYSGANFVLLGFVLVQLESMWSWQDFDQMSVIPRELWNAGRYRHTSFPKLGRCSQYPGLAHQYVAYKDPRRRLPRMYFQDLEYNSCLNGWTMGNIASTGEDLAAFFFDVFQGKFVNKTTLATMTDFHPLSDDWCEGPKGAGSCQYGLGFMRDQVGQDVFKTKDPNADPEAVRVDGHPGQDWGSGCSPCGYNSKYSFGVCVASASIIGMNCSAPIRANVRAYEEASCLIYDAVLSAVGGPRLDCISNPQKRGFKLHCEWGHSTPPNEHDRLSSSLVGDFDAQNVAALLV